MNIGKKIRIKRLLNRVSGKTVIVPMDHGVSMGPIDGLQDVDATVNMVIRGGANAAVVHKGMNPCRSYQVFLLMHRVLP